MLLYAKEYQASITTKPFIDSQTIYQISYLLNLADNRYKQYS